MNIFVGDFSAAAALSSAPPWLLNILGWIAVIAIPAFYAFGVIAFTLLSWCAVKFLVETGRD